MASMGTAAKDSVLFHSILEIQNQNFSVALTANSIVWDIPHNQGTNKPTNVDISQKSIWNVIASLYSVIEPGPQVVNLRDVIAVAPEAKPRLRRADRPQSEPTSFTLYVIRRISQHRWRDRAVTFQCWDALACQNWIERINQALDNKEFNRPRNLLVLINPHSGKERGPKLYQNKVAPLFQLAGITTEVIVTTHANHAREMLLERDLTGIDGVISVGGDGMFSEILHGLLLRSRRDAGLVDNTERSSQITPNIRIGVIPAGSTDAVTYSTHGTGDAITCALHIILGDDLGVDVFSVHNKSGFVRYGLAMIAYGFLGEVIRQSELYRWLGPKRYDYLGVKEFLNGREYAGEIMYRGSPTNSTSTPTDGAICLAGCGVCREAQDDKTDARQKEDSGATPSSEPWQRFRCRFTSLATHSLSSRCEKSPAGPSPSAHVGDGCLDMIIVQSSSKLQLLKYLIRAMDPHSDQFECDYVKVLRCREFRFRPLLNYDPDKIELDSISAPSGGQEENSWAEQDSSDPSVSAWNCDGELLEEAELHVRNHCQLIRLFSRGIEDEEADDDAQVSYRWSLILKQLAHDEDAIATGNDPIATVTMATDDQLTDRDMEVLKTISDEELEKEWTNFMRLRPWISKTDGLDVARRVRSPDGEECQLGPDSFQILEQIDLKPGTHSESIIGRMESDVAVPRTCATFATSDQRFVAKEVDATALSVSMEAALDRLVNLTIGGVVAEKTDTTTKTSVSMETALDVGVRNWTVETTDSER